MKSKFNPILIAFAIPAAAVVFALVFISLKKANVLESGEDFPASSFLESPGAFQGNSYVLRAQIDSQLVFNPRKGRILSVRTADGKRLSVFLPAGKGDNLQVGQRYNLKVAVDRDGLIVVKGMEKY